MSKKFNREKVIEEIVDDFNEYQVHDSYWFEDSKIQIEWSRDQECYLILNQDKTFDYARPSDLKLHIEDLTDKDLKDYWEDSND